MISWPDKIIPVVVEGEKEGYLLYVQSGEQFENDIWTCVHCEGGIVRHYLSCDVRVHYNSTFGIKRQALTEKEIDDMLCSPISVKYKSREEVPEEYKHVWDLLNKNTNQ